MRDDPPELTNRFVMQAGRRGALTWWVVIVTLLWFISVLALVQAVSQRTTGDAGGAGHVFIPLAGISFAGLALCVVVARWWEDETEFRLTGGRLEIRHGVGPFHWPAVRLDASEPVIFTGDGARGSLRAFVAQGNKRVLLGSADAIVPLQYSRWVHWMRHHGLVVEQHWDVAGA